MTETCENCEHWLERGPCLRLKTQDGNCLAADSTYGKNVKPWAGFGCVLFEEKEQGPFLARRTVAKDWVIEAPSILPDCGVIGMGIIAVWTTEERAKGICDWLNERWAERENDD